MTPAYAILLTPPPSRARNRTLDGAQRSEAPKTVVGSAASPAPASASANRATTDAKRTTSALKQLDLDLLVGPKIICPSNKIGATISLCVRENIEAER